MPFKRTAIWLHAALSLQLSACSTAPGAAPRSGDTPGLAAPSGGAAGLSASVLGGRGAVLAGAGAAGVRSTAVGGRGPAAVGGGAAGMGAAGIGVAGRVATLAGAGAAGPASADHAAAGSGGAVVATDIGVDASQGFKLTVYHTPVESFHTGAPSPVTGCSKMPCANGHEDLGSYPDDFVQAVKDDGSGRITNGARAGKYLNWSIDIGYWLDDAARDARGMALVPWVSAAADPKVAYGTKFRITDCGVDEAQGTPIDAAVCTKIKNGAWSVNDRFTVGSVGAYFDLYIGEEDHAMFDATSPLLITTIHAQIAVMP